MSASQTFYSSPQAFSSATDDWATPQAFFDTLNKEFEFVLDTAASATNRKTAAWLGLDHPDPLRRDGLAFDWATESALLGGPVWCNPPYGRRIGEWTSKADEECARGALVVMLLPARTDTRWFHNDCAHHELRFIKGRLKFGAGTAPAPFPSLVVVMRP